MFLEVIGTSLADCEMIVSAGNVNRIELCANLEHGGYTPEYQVIKECCAKINLPIRVIVRHSDENFYCPAWEYEQMKKDIDFIKTTKADGIVIGILTPTNEIDLVRMQELIMLASPLNVTFHRAFDLIKDKQQAIIQLKNLGVKTVLTQGGETPILTNLTTFKEISGHGVQIQGGSGINLTNYQTVLPVVDAIHIGSAVRVNQSWNEPIDLALLQQFQEKKSND
ncbi:copper homeostasis protein [Spiroplasma syrphidicola EA-1]|uniref:Copper homeostasis protein cutC homolog n=1 Tax=Spiroplasma syrphidicola EA-1 TaxID=1276229 RepID=R4UJR3_9MOLU|nr:copper homeostasis protein CutC [Spiroplasma syrphidicola]AGM26385.1 copper homeostasis protein [Spiroplasma syrphidicola EA-1]